MERNLTLVALFLSLNCQRLPLISQKFTSCFGVPDHGAKPLVIQCSAGP